LLGEIAVDQFNGDGTGTHGTRDSLREVVGDVSHGEDARH
jgi:hypothetical protein